MVTVNHLEDDRFAGLLETAPDAMVCVDADGRIALVNAQTERLFGYGRDELVGQPVEILVPDAARDAHPGHRAGYVTDPQHRPMGAGMELAGRRRDGTTFPAEISLSAIGTEEGILVSAAVRDATQRRLAAETAAQLASIIQSSHDAVIGKTLDQIITSWNPGAERLYGYTTAEMVGRHIEVLIPLDDQAREAEVVAAVVRGERVDQYQTRRLRKDGTAVELSLTLSPIADRSGAIVGVATVARDLTERQRADARFRGLMEAAPDAMVCVNRNGRIELVNAQTEQLFGYGRDELIGQPVEILVPGTGIPKGVIDRVFEPFFTTKPKGEGTGLGLATVYGIITQAGGHVRIYSEPGLGTILTALLPITEHALAPATPQAVQPQHGHGQTVLVVEDEPAMREVTRRILDRNGYHVVAAASGREALNLLASQLEHIDVLLTDVIMPGMQGKELADKIRILQPAARVIFMSGYTQGLLGDQGVLEPGVHLIEKPFSETTLLTKLHETLSSNN